MKKALSAAALVLAAGMLTSCGGGPPDDASKEEFCGVFKDFEKDMGELKPDDTKSFVKGLKDVGDKLEETGTPSDIPDDARAGFEKTLELIDGLDEDMKQSELEDIDKDLSSTEKKNSDAFDEYLNKTCDI